ncbi:MAG: formylglycine-generating enzyme family protein [Gallionellaceae bacterium]|jgi:iron(II)-dependent oxidoreductase|nr:formylglycine-generating enzyme family protein [Gallionellaceae bacterium]
MTESVYKRPVIPPEERAQRKRYLSATLITCMVLLMIGGTLHVVKLGANRMNDMRSLATYDLKEEKARVRAAGEDIVLHEEHEARAGAISSYTADELEKLLTKDQWLELESMVLIPAGSFEMGTSLERADDQDKPQHTITLPDYKIDKYPVTNAQYARFVVATGHRPPSSWKNGRIPQGEQMRPVTMVSWFDAEAYAKWAGKRLPTEAEWEKAARGTDGRRWPWGNKMDPALLNTYYNKGSTTNVDTYPQGASPYGAIDMAGDVDEWTADDFVPYPGSSASPDLFRTKAAKPASPASAPQDQPAQATEAVSSDKNYKVLRGGSWKSDPFSTSSFHRDFAWANYASDFYGFRCVADIPKAKGK